MKNLFFLLIIIFIVEMKGDACPMADSTKTACGILKKDSVFSFSSPKGYVPSLFHNFGAQFTAPLHIRLRDIYWTAGVACVTATLIHYDHAIDEKIRYTKDNSGFVRVTSPVITQFGNTYGLGLVGALGIFGLATGNRKLFQTSLMASQAAITSGIWVRLVKYCTSRERPSASYTFAAQKGHPGGYWYGFFKQYDKSVTSIGRDISFFDAFPSGHTSTAFSIATVFAMQYSDRKAIPIIAYSMAGLVGLSRMTEHEHWASDVFVGAFAGYLCAKQVVFHHRKIFASAQTAQHLNRKKTMFYLTAADNFAGLKLKMVY